MNIACFGVRDYELPIINKISSDSGFVLDINKEYLNDSNYSLAFGYEAIIIRANCILSKKSLLELKKRGLKYLLTRTVGYNHIDIDECKKLGIRVAYAPGYSPNSIAELNLSLALSLFRNIPEAINNAKNYDFTLNNRMFGKEIRNCTIGIIGCGRIGYQTAVLYRGLGAKVLGYDQCPNIHQRDSIKYVDLDFLLKESDIISINMSYSKEKNHHFIDKNKMSKMKDGAIIINTARGELIDTISLIEFIKSQKIFGAGLDVVENEEILFFKKNKSEDLSPVHKELIDLYPRVIITPHISSSTDKAVLESFLISINNLKLLMSNTFILAKI